MIAVVTGHRPSALGGYERAIVQTAKRTVQHAYRTWLRENKPEGTIIGMAQGVDQWIAEECASSGVKYAAAVPFPGQESLWPVDAQRHYRELLTHAHSVYYVRNERPLSKAVAAHAMNARNMWMVDQMKSPSDKLVAFWNGQSGGTGNCVRYAYLKSKLVENLWVNPLGEAVSDPSGMVTK